MSIIQSTITTNTTNTNGLPHNYGYYDVQSPPIENDCDHTFPLWMVIPPQGCTVNCPICGKPRFIQSTQITC